MHAALDTQRLQLAGILVTHHGALRACLSDTLPSGITLDGTINPFGRVEVPALVQTARTRSAADGPPVAVFAALRSWKNEFR